MIILREELGRMFNVTSEECGEGLSDDESLKG